MICSADNDMIFRNKLFEIIIRNCCYYSLYKAFRSNRGQTLNKNEPGLTPYFKLKATQMRTNKGSAKFSLHIVY